MLPNEDDILHKYSAYEDPAFFRITLENRHAEQLIRRNLDEESRMEVVYRVLKDQLRHAKKDLLNTKKEKEHERLIAMESKKRRQ